MSPFRIGDRVRLRLHAGSTGTIAANPYDFRGTAKAGVTWDGHLGIWACPVNELVHAYRPSVPPEARPLSVGGLASPERRFA